MHIASQSRMASLFTLAEWCAVTFDGDVGVRTCGGRVNVLRRRRCGGDVVTSGVVLREEGGLLLCGLETNEEMWLPKPDWDNQDKIYVPGEFSNRRRIEHFIPIRMMLNVDGNISFTLNRFTIESNTNNIVFES